MQYGIPTRLIQENVAVLVLRIGLRDLRLRERKTVVSPPARQLVASDVCLSLLDYDVLFRQSLCHNYSVGEQSFLPSRVTQT